MVSCDARGLVGALTIVQQLGATRSGRRRHAVGGVWVFASAL